MRSVVWPECEVRAGEVLVDAIRFALRPHGLRAGRPVGQTLKALGQKSVSRQMSHRGVRVDAHRPSVQDQPQAEAAPLLGRAPSR